MVLFPPLNYSRSLLQRLYSFPLLEVWTTVNPVAMGDMNKMWKKRTKPLSRKTGQPGAPSGLIDECPSTDACSFATESPSLQLLRFSPKESRRVREAVWLPTCRRPRRGCTDRRFSSWLVGAKGRNRRDRCGALSLLIRQCNETTVPQMAIGGATPGTRPGPPGSAGPTDNLAFCLR